MGVQMEDKMSGKTKVKILRGYQNYEIGSVVELENKNLPRLFERRVVELYKEPQAVQNRAVGLANEMAKPIKKSKVKKKEIE